jgi:hypothetical protein
MKPEPAGVFPHLYAQFDDLLEARRTCSVAYDTRPVNPRFACSAIERYCYYCAHQPEQDATRNKQGEETQANPDRGVQVVC